MATLVFTALGTAIGGPLGGALGSLIGNSIDRSVFGSRKVEGARLKELAASTSAYGNPIPRHFGRMRAGGTVIWATDLAESSERSGGGKGRPATTTYSYSASFAVALASRPIRGIGRIWADGSLLHGAAGDLKVGGQLRLYTGHGDQTPDPLIAADKGTAPAFRGIAYCVFEGLQLANFGNRIPTLSFEIIADEGPVAMEAILSPLGSGIETAPLPETMDGISDEGGAVADLLQTLDTVFPMSCDAGGEGLSIRTVEDFPATTPALPEPASFAGDDGFAAATGITRNRLADASGIPNALRYYDTGRDYQPGLQRADGRARAGRGRTLELPGSFSAATARALVNRAADRAARARDRLSWRVAELDPALKPGAVVTAPGHDGHWLIESWEWRDQGIELELSRLPRGAVRAGNADAGQSLSAADVSNGPTRLIAFELPWDGQGSSDQAAIFAALSSPAPGWSGAALFADRPSGLASIGHSGARRMVLGATTGALPGAPSLRFDRAATLEVQLAGEDLALTPASVEALANGANRALVGGELLQFALAVHLGQGSWRLSGLLRGRGGTEAAARSGHAAGAAFALIDDRLLKLDADALSGVGTIAALGLRDEEPVHADIIGQGRTLAPLSPVHGRCIAMSDGGLALSWTRRARGAWNWPDHIDTPLNEQAETYRVGIGDPASPALWWQTSEPELTMPPALLPSLHAQHSGQSIWVRQLGTHDVSPPLLLTTLA